MYYSIEKMEKLIAFSFYMAKAIIKNTVINNIGETAIKTKTPITLSRTFKNLMKIVSSALNFKEAPTLSINFKKLSHICCGYDTFLFFDFSSIYVNKIQKYGT